MDKFYKVQTYFCLIKVLNFIKNAALYGKIEKYSIHYQYNLRREHSRNNIYIIQAYKYIYIIQTKI